MTYVDKIVLVHESASPVRIAGLFDHQATHFWLFLGGDYARLRAWEEALGAHFTRIDISRMLSDAADFLRGVYVEWTDESSRRYGKDADWWFTNIAERNPLSSPLFLHICYLYLIRKLCQGSMERPHLIVMESWSLLHSARLVLRTERLPYRVVDSWKGVLQLIRRPAILLYGWLRFCGTVARGYVAALRTRPFGSRSLDKNPNKPVVIIDTFVHEDAWSSEGVFHDRYFPVLHEWLEKRGWDVWVLPTLYDIRGPLKDVVSRLRRDPKKFIIREDWLTFTDTLSALWCSMKALCYPRRTPPILDFDVAYLVREECWRQASSAGTMHAKLLSRLPSRLVSTGLNPALVIDWFENQKIDKALTIGFRKAYPAVTIVGAQCFLPLPNYLVGFPTRAEWESGVTPDRIVCCGRHQAKTIKLFKSEVPVEIGAALRFQYLLHDCKPESSNVAKTSSTVLITLPSRVSEAVELLDLVSPAIQTHLEVAHWYVKRHPDYLVDKAHMANVYGGGRWPDRVEVWPGGLDEAFAKADVVISTGSGTVMEAACLGIPVIVVGRQTGLTFNPMAWFEDFGQVCYSADEISRNLSTLLHLSFEEKKRLRERGERLREACYEPLTDESLRPYLGGLDVCSLKTVDMT